MYATVYEKGRRRLTKLRNLQTVKKTCQNAGSDFPIENCKTAYVHNSCDGFCPLAEVGPPLPAKEEGYVSCRLALRTWQ